MPARTGPATSSSRRSRFSSIARVALRQKPQALVAQGQQPSRPRPETGRRATACGPARPGPARCRRGRPGRRSRHRRGATRGPPRPACRSTAGGSHARCGRAPRPACRRFCCASAMARSAMAIDRPLSAQQQRPGPARQAQSRGGGWRGGHWRHAGISGAASRAGGILAGILGQALTNACISASGAWPGRGCLLAHRHAHRHPALPSKRLQLDLGGTGCSCRATSTARRTAARPEGVEGTCAQTTRVAVFLPGPWLEPTRVRGPLGFLARTSRAATCFPPVFKFLFSFFFFHC